MRAHVPTLLTAAAVGYCVLAGLQASSAAPSPVAVVSSLALVSDDTTALFPSTALAPGRPVTRCTGITYTGGPTDGAQVELQALDVTGPLASRLLLRVDAGQGDCDGSSLRQVYEGSLADLSSAPTGWVPAAGQRWTFRLTVTLAQDAPDDGAGAAATLRWTVTATDTVTPSGPGAPRTPAARKARSGTAALRTPVTPAPSDAAADDPLDAPAAGLPGVPGVPGVPGAPGAPQASQASGSGRGAGSGGGGGTGSGGRFPGSGGGAGEDGSSAAEVLGDIVDVADRAAGHAGYPGAAATVLLGFLVVQRKLDGRDPKLAAAPLTADRYAYFEDAS